MKVSLVYGLTCFLDATSSALPSAMAAANSESSALEKRNDGYLVMCKNCDPNSGSCDWKQNWNTCVGIGSNVHWMVTGESNGQQGCAIIWEGSGCTGRSTTMCCPGDTCCNINTGFYIRSYRRVE
uniref:Killer toxin n=1 Tax=Cyberlindnera saturnus TaxID=907340 RepID=TOXK_CYBSA|nr:RecName: Full=Killer toxin; Flags: Precursor [Cyberlindnera saturnus]BAA02705.1 killer toxin [Cyberlindnera saturnus]prf//2005200B killer toxin [Cyberlindnera mrakii]